MIQHTHRPFRPLLLTALLLLAMALLAPHAAAGPPAQSTATPLPPAPDAPAAPSNGALGAAAMPPDTETQINSVVLPPRDLNALAQRLDGVTVIPTPPPVPAQVWRVGDTATFWVDDVDNDAQFQVEATLRYLNDHVYMWVQNGYAVDDVGLQRSADVFAETTYPLIHEAFGREDSPGIDGDPRIYILHAGSMGYSVAAYFASGSAYPTAAVETSNAHEMFFVNLDTMQHQIGTAYYDGVLAHEFQHMVHFFADSNEDTWLNEAFSMLTGLLTGFDRDGFSGRYLSAPTTQLNAWPENASHLAHYGGSFLFLTYFYERFGEDATRALLANPFNGVHSVDDTLAALGLTDPVTGAPLTMDAVFADWTITNLINDPAVGDGRYAYTLLPTSLPAAAITESVRVYPFNISAMPAAQYSATYVQLTHVGPGAVQVDFTGAEQVRLVPTDAPSGDYMWYSNRGDSSDSTLTRAFTLSGVDKATLEYDVWYDIESLWDYGYLMISTDDGATWEILHTAHTTDDNPHNNAYGPGYTGRSGGGSTASWVHEEIDLTPFVGGDVLIRFELITDEATNQPGMVIDNLSIAEIGYFDDFEKGIDGWEADGWLLIDNVLPQRWIVQAVTQVDGQTAVTRLIGPDDAASGTWTFPVGADAGAVTLVISPLAPVTTEPGLFDLTLSPVE